MRAETKNVIYMALDILDSLDRTSNESNFLKMNKKTYDIVKEEIYELLKNDYRQVVDNKNETFIFTGIKKTGKFQNSNDLKYDNKTEVIGLLPSILIDKKKFQTNEDIAKFAKDSLNLEVPFWKKRSRNEIIGNLISMVASKPEEELSLFFKAWKEFYQNGYEEKKEENVNKNYVDVWLDFFNRYKG